MPLHFEGSLTARDCKRQIIHAFTLRTGRLLEVDFRFSPRALHGVENLITLTLFDPQGFRGAGHRGGTHHLVHIGLSAATPGYFAGPLPPGRWMIEIDTHMIMPGPPVRYELDVRVSDEGPEVTGRVVRMAVERSMPVPERVDGVLGRGAGWYRGDLHTHTEHSDATAFSVADLLQTVQELGLDFVFLTDHNTTSGLPELDALSSTILAGGGMELTTFWGHALCLGTREWVDWRVAPGSGGMGRLVAGAAARDHVFVIAHPEAVGDPACTGCRWRFGEMMPGNAGLVEVWNGPWGGDSNNENALSLWYDWLNQGLRLVATAGSDYHGPVDAAASEVLPEDTARRDAAADARVGFSVIFAEALSEKTLLEALKAGHLYLSAGPQVYLEAVDGQGGSWMMGDGVPPELADALSFTVSWRACPPASSLRLMVNGRLFRQWPADGEGTTTWQMSGCDADWIAVEVRDGAGAMLALTNPIYLGLDCEDVDEVAGEALLSSESR